MNLPQNIYADNLALEKADSSFEPLSRFVGNVLYDLPIWNEERVWNNWESWLRVPPLEFFAILGSVIEQGEHHHRTFEAVCPGFDVSRQRHHRGSSGESDSFRPDELYLDVIPRLTELRAATPTLAGLADSILYSEHQQHH